MSKIFDSIEVREEVKQAVDLSFEIADQIHEILEKQGKSQRDLARILGKKESEVSKWLTGTHNFTTKSIAKISVALGEKIIVTPNRASKDYSESKFIPVKVHANINSPVATKGLTEVTWKTTSNLNKSA
jgi:transcriptional regulator with XRE-family HTH domain